MTNSFDPAPFQPLGVFFDLTMGSVNQIYKSPQIPISFRMKLDPIAEIEFSLFDANGDIDDAIRQSRNPQTGIAGGTFSFGYTNVPNMQSPVYGFDIEDYDPVFMGEYFILNIRGTSILSPLVSSNQNSGTIQEIIDQFCQNHGLTVNISPPFGVSYMQDAGYVDKNSTAFLEMQHSKLVSESDLAYLNRILRWARDAQGKGNYSAYITNQDGKKVLNVVRPLNFSPNYTFDVQGQTNVISWKPKLSYSSAVLDANDVQTNGYQRVSGDEQKGVFQQQTTAPFQETFGYEYSPSISSTPYKDPASDLTYFCSDTMPSEVTGSSVRSRPAASASPYAGLNVPLDSHLRSWMESTEGELTIMGDPTISPISGDNFTLAQINCYKPFGTMGSQSTPKVLHYSSGLYMVSSVEQVISAGSYRTILQLERAASPSP